VASISDLASGDKLTAAARQETTRFGAPTTATAVVNFPLAPHSFRAFHID